MGSLRPQEACLNLMKLVALGISGEKMVWNRRLEVFCATGWAGYLDAL